MSSGMNVGDTYSAIASNLDSSGAAMQKSITDAASGDLSNADLMNLQFQLGNYNTKQEAMSGMMKGILDMLKSLAQRVS